MKDKYIAVICGINAAGKTREVDTFILQDYERVNRDTTGGSLEDQLAHVERIFKLGGDKVVLDNTYPTVGSRASLIKLAKKVGADIVCHWVSTSLEEAQMNFCLRTMRKYGKIPNPDEFKNFKDPGVFPPAALFHYRKTFEKPTKAEGFDDVIEMPFRRVWGQEYVNKAIILDYDGTLRLSKGSELYPVDPSEVKVLPNRTKVLSDCVSRGFKLLGASNQSGIAKGKLSDKMADDCFRQTNNLLGLDIEYMYCPHRIPPLTCYCRKPQCGIGAYFIEKYKLNPEKCVMVGDMTSDKSFAERCGFKFMYANEFFK